MSYETVIQIENGEVGYTSGNVSVHVATDINVEVYKGELICLLGQNGCGKSTLLRTIAGMQTSLRGKFLVDNQEIMSFSAEDLAKQMSVVLTDTIDNSNLTVYDIVALGRYPYVNWLGLRSKNDEVIIKNTLQQVGLQSLTNRKFCELSDGEKQRTMIAKALAQDTPIMLLDEPTSHLDVPNRIEIMMLLKTLAHTLCKSIIISTHELDLALQVADRLWLMKKGEKIVCGTPEDLVLSGVFLRAFQRNSFHFNMETGAFVIQNEKKVTVSLSGDSIRSFWTERALNRHGISISKSQQEAVRIEVLLSSWKVYNQHNYTECHSIFELLKKVETIL